MITMVGMADGFNVHSSDVVHRLVSLPAILCLSIQGIIDSPQVQTSRLTVINHAVSDLIMVYIAPAMTRNSIAFDIQRYQFRRSRGISRMRLIRAIHRNA